ncbi:UDP-N-acetylmuramate dehydrogenase [Bacteroidales bacterium OttesenSCG-928-I21]|nr:UDP-N-acetylmuramate dehydrogenase [Bacteroidales bacterium OttesenSCG-928-I21]
MKIIDNYSLTANNTFKTETFTQKFVEYYTDDEIVDFVKNSPDIFLSKFLIIGEASNILFVDNYKGTIIHPATKNISVISENLEYFFIRASAGVIFDDLVKYSLEKKMFGLENLSGIPGTVGASAVQNIGAYGSEVENYIEEVEFLNLNNLKIETKKNGECKFSYRDSIFKNELKNKAIILSVSYRLNKKFTPNLSYTDLANYFSENSPQNQSAELIRKIVINIRNNKLPDPKIIGNAGSFFKNPVINQSKFEALKLISPDVKYYPAGENMFKIAAGWLIDNCKLKGFTHKGAAVDEKQALVLINKQTATGKDILELAKIVQSKVYDKFKIILEPEVLIVEEN